MNNTKLIAMLICLSCTKLQAQIFQKNFLGKDFKQYKGLLFTLNKEAQSGFLMSFYTQFEKAKLGHDEGVAFPTKKYVFATEKDSLLNKIFKVENIVGNNQEEYSDKAYYERPIFILLDTVSKQRIYYRFNFERESDFPFLTSPVKFDENETCALLDREKDGFTGDIRINSLLFINHRESQMAISKFVTKGVSNYYLNLYANSSVIKFDASGIIILFEDGSKLTKPTKLDVKAGDSGFDYSAFIPLTPADLALLTKKKVQKFRIYAFDRDVSPSDAERFTIFMRCIQKTK